MPKVELAPGWKGTANQGKWDNHESSLNDAEMKALVLKIADIAGMKAPLADTMHAKFRGLATALAAGDDVTITVTKGIHERDTKCHFDVQAPGVAGTFHVFLAPGGSHVITGTYAPTGGWGPKKKYQVEWTLTEFLPSGLSIPSGGRGSPMLTWPAVMAVSALEKGFGRPRRYSFSAGNSTAPVTSADTSGSHAYRKVTVVT